MFKLKLCDLRRIVIICSGVNNNRALVGSVDAKVRANSNFLSLHLSNTTRIGINRTASDYFRSRLLHQSTAFAAVKLFDVIKAAKIHLPSTQSHHALTIRHYNSRVVTSAADTERNHSHSWQR